MNEAKDNSTLPMSSSRRSEDSPDETIALTRPPGTFASGEQTTLIQDAAIEPSPLKHGQPLLIDNRFAIQKEIGRGGIGVTYLAIDAEDNDNPVVVKVLIERPEKAYAAWVERKFHGEIKALSRINHPGVVKFVSSGVMPDGKLYLAMEYVEGSDLRALIRPEKGIDDFERIANFIRQMGEAIAAAHAAGVYHRDLKPENIMVSSSGDEERVKVIDFGIATVKESLDEKTKTTVLAGSARYMAPEQIRGKPTAASDVYALGVIAYEMITGRAPFNSDLRHPLAAMNQLFEMQRRGVRAMPKDLRPSLPEGAQEIILKALSFQPGARYKRADEFGRDLAGSLTEQYAEELAEGFFDKGTASTAQQVRQIKGGQNVSATKKEVGWIGTPESKRSPALKIAISVSALAIAVMIAFFASSFFKDKANERTLSYWALAQGYKNKKPDGAPIRLLGSEMYFNTGDELQFFLTSADAGHLYLLSEDATESGTQYNLLFPTPKANNSSSSIQANAEIATDRIFFEGRAATEKVWLVWAASAIGELESEVKRWRDPIYLGEIKDTAKVASIKNFLKQISDSNLQIEQDEANKRTVMRAKGDILVKLLNLTHR